MNRPIRRLLRPLCLALALPLLLAAGCAGLPVAGPDAASAAELLDYLAATVRLPAAAQKRELAQAALDYKTEASPLARVRLGGLHAQPAAALRDDARALALLEPSTRVAPEAARDAVQRLGALLHAQVAERVRAMREDARRHDLLRQQLEALKAVERSIAEREERMRQRVR